MNQPQGRAFHIAHDQFKACRHTHYTFNALRATESILPKPRAEAPRPPVIFPRQLLVRALVLVRRVRATVTRPRHVAVQQHHLRVDAPSAHERGRHAVEVDTPELARRLVRPEVRLARAAHDAVRDRGVEGQPLRARRRVRVQAAVVQRREGRYGAGHDAVPVGRVGAGPLLQKVARAGEDVRRRGGEVQLLEGEVAGRRAVLERRLVAFGQPVG